MLPERCTRRPAAVCLAALLGLAWPALAAALTTATAAPELTCTAAQANPNASADDLLPHLQACQNDTAFLARLGRLLNAERRYPEAAEHLERAILLQPDATDMQMDYAIALAGSGDLVSALQLMAGLLARVDLPAPQRASLQALRARWAQAARAPLQQTRLQAGLRLGYDNNLLGAPNLSSLTLTLAGEQVRLPLDATNLPRGGAYLRADVRADHTRVQPDGTRWDIGAALLQRHSQAVPEAGSQQAELAAERTQAHHYASVSAAWLEARSGGVDGTRFHNLAAATGWQWAQGASCQWRVGAELQQRTLQTNRLLSGRYTGASAQWACASAQPGGPQWRVQLRTGRDTPQQANRPGGAQAEHALRGLLRWPTGPQGAWLLEADISRTQDSAGYSPLLDQGARRQVQRHALRVEYQHTLAPGVLWLVGAEQVNQQSNLPLFGLRSGGAYAGLRANW